MNILKIYGLFLSVLLLMGFVPAEKPASEIEWVSMEEAAEMAEKDGKKILVDLYTDWCGWCRVMDRDTYSDAEIVSYINENYHAVKFDAEQKAEVNLKGTTYKYLANAGRRGVHEIAVNLTSGKLSYPNTVFLNSDLTKLTNVPGYVKADEMMVILSYFAEDAYKTTSWDKYRKDQEANSGR